MKKAGLRDLSVPTQNNIARARMPKVIPETISLDLVDPQLLLSAGDQPGRQTLFNFDDTKACRETVVLDKTATVMDYRTKDFKRTHRLMMTVPPVTRKLIEQITGNEASLNAALIALAEYGAKHLLDAGKTLHVTGATDDRKKERAAARIQVRMAYIRRGN